MARSLSIAVIEAALEDLEDRLVYDCKEIPGYTRSILRYPEEKAVIRGTLKLALEVLEEAAR